MLVWGHKYPYEGGICFFFLSQDDVALWFLKLYFPLLVTVMESGFFFSSCTLTRLLVAAIANTKRVELCLLTMAYISK